MSAATQTTPTATVAAGVEFAHVDPRALIIETNVRTVADLDVDFLDSIRTHGVRTPVKAIRDAEGSLVLRAGQRRTLAAIETDQATVPVYITEAAAPGEAERIFEQMDENDARRALTGHDRASAFQQLTLLGVSASQIAKRSHHTRVTVNDALTVAASPLAAAALAKHNIPLDLAAVIAEFDDSAIVDDLTAYALEEPEQFAHRAQRHRDDRDAQVAVDALTAELATVGVVVVDRPSSEDQATPLHSLRGAAGEYGITAEAHATCPGRAAFISRGYGTPHAVDLCLDPKTHGHPSTHTSYASGGSGIATGPMTEEQKADRRDVIQGNRNWRSAEKVRRAWLRTFAARKTTPKDAAALLAYAVTECNTDLSHAAQNGHTLARTALGLDAAPRGGYGGFTGSQSTITNAIDAANPSRAQLIGLVIVLAAIEARTGTHTWRNPDENIARYLRALASWGYNLSEVEQSTLDSHEGRNNTSTPDTAADGGQDDDYDDDAISGAEVAGEEAQGANDAQE